MRAFYTHPVTGFTADLCLMTNGHSTRITVRNTEGHIIHRDYYKTWKVAIKMLKYMLPGAVNDLTHEPLT